MIQNIFETSAFCVLVLIALAHMNVGLPSKDYPKTSYVLGCCVIFFGAVAFLSGIAVIWQ